MKSALETTGLSKRYGSTWALRDCSLRIPAGRIVALVGPNGAGKTTLLHLAMGLLKPTAGSATVLGWSALANPTLVLASVGFIAQDRPLYKRLTVEQMLGFGAHLPTVGRQVGARSASERRRAIQTQSRQALWRPAGPSRPGPAFGETARAAASRQPVSNLDPLARREFTKALLDAAAADGLTVVFSSHVVAELERFCDYLVILAGGQVQIAGDVDELADW
jgi:ABC-2 type transport system ATP-binding protein